MMDGRWMFVLYTRSLFSRTWHRIARLKIRRLR